MKLLYVFKEEVSTYTHILHIYIFKISKFGQWFWNYKNRRIHTFQSWICMLIKEISLTESVD